MPNETSKDLVFKIISTAVMTGETWWKQDGWGV
jgi:hypothetical protein